ncbi:MAG: 4Fe-4S binding protein [Desulfonauticus sp.]|nr:4Fe-4S binding protein [Desulfonauticus sp.]
MPFGFGWGRGRGKCGSGGICARGRKRFLPEEDKFCICPRCKTIIPHQRGIPCYQTICPQCGSPMTRQFCQQDGDRAKPQKALLPYVDKNLCTGCKNCLDICPTGALQYVDNKAVIDVQTCKGCLACLDACPEGAIKHGKNNQ